MITSHPLRTEGETQCAAILRELEANQGNWVPMPRLYECSGAFAVHSRIADLRKAGHTITNQRRTALTGRVFISEYMLVKEETP